MVHDILSEIVSGAAETAMEAGTEEIHRRWGWAGCVAAILAVVAAMVFVLWLLGVFEP